MKPIIFVSDVIRIIIVVVLAIFIATLLYRYFRFINLQLVHKFTIVHAARQGYNSKAEILAPHKAGDSVDWYENKVVKDTY
jgi:hypothetical protein